MTDDPAPRYFRLRLDEHGEVYEEPVDLSGVILGPAVGIPVDLSDPDVRRREAERNELAIAEAEAFCEAVDAVSVSRGGIQYPTPKDSS